MLILCPRVDLNLDVEEYSGGISRPRPQPSTVILKKIIELIKTLAVEYLHQQMGVTLPNPG